ncbi:MAG: hypothetical protein HZC42_12800 [Candidatus Eisenbacteria bacterium]|nr:hypothetical protein [Candidatus Eisenbacteria bacterium]
MLVVYEVTSANVYPAVSCYRPDLGPDGLSKLVPGTYTGLPYSYRGGEPYDPGTIVNHLYGEGRGAGNASLLAEVATQCVSLHTTGIDCSQFASAAWAVLPRFTVYSLTHNEGSIALGVSARKYVRKADAFAIDVPGAHHVILFSDAVGADGNFYSYEASSRDPAQCTSKLRNYFVLENMGYHPWVSVKLKDDPASQIVRFDVDPAGESPVIRWATLIEDRTSSFSIWRADAPQGPFVQISPEVAAKGSISSGADYQFVDVTHGLGSAYYRLVEMETTGRIIQHGTRSLAEARAWSRQEH